MPRGVFKNPEERIRKIKLARARQIITDEHKKHISEALKGRVPWNKGKKMSQDFKEKRRKLAKKSWQNPEIREKRIRGMKGRKLTEETKKKIGTSNKRRWLNKSKKEKEKFSKIAKERQKELWKNPEYKAMMIENHKGKVGYWRNKKRPEISGEKCYLWRGGKTKLVKKIRESIEYKIWRQKVFERDNYTCQICGKRGVRLEVDHFPKSFAGIIREYKIKTLEEALNCEKLWDINNGRTLCLGCHKKTENYLKKVPGN